MSGRAESHAGIHLLMNTPAEVWGVGGGAVNLFLRLRSRESSFSRFYAEFAGRPLYLGRWLWLPEQSTGWKRARKPRREGGFPNDCQWTSHERADWWILSQAGWEGQPVLLRRGWRWITRFWCSGLVVWVVLTHAGNSSIPMTMIWPWPCVVLEQTQRRQCYLLILKAKVSTGMLCYMILHRYCIKKKIDWRFMATLWNGK